MYCANKRGEISLSYRIYRGRSEGWAAEVQQVTPDWGSLEIPITSIPFHTMTMDRLSKVTLICPSLHAASNTNGKAKCTRNISQPTVNVPTWLSLCSPAVVLRTSTCAAVSSFKIITWNLRDRSTICYGQAASRHTGGRCAISCTMQNIWCLLVVPREDSDIYETQISSKGWLTTPNDTYYHFGQLYEGVYWKEAYSSS